MIYIIFAPPREGKTYFATMKVLNALRKNKRPVFTNYPVVYIVPLSLHKWLINKFIKLNNLVLWFMPSKLSKLFRLIKRKPFENALRSSYVWEERFIYEGLRNALIVIDEAYRSFSSRSWKDFDVDTHTFFATNGHDGNDIYLIAQHMNRLDGIIREMVNTFYYVVKWCIPFTDRPLMFHVRGYLSEDDFISRKRNEGAVYARYFIFPSRKVKKGYDTHYFKHEEPATDFISWLDTIED